MRRIRTSRGFMSEAYAIREGLPFKEADVVPLSPGCEAYTSSFSFNQTELEEVSRLVALYHRVRASKQYSLSDRIRYQISLWDSSLRCLQDGRIGTWFESVFNRNKRLYRRYLETGVVPYPYTSSADFIAGVLNA